MEQPNLTTKFTKKKSGSGFVSFVNFVVKQHV